jgi:VanZ family protein
VGPRRIASLLLPPLAVMILIFILSGQPGDGEDKALWEVLLRKLAHVTEYALLTLATWRAARGLRPHWPPSAHLALAAAVSLLYAGTDEWHQTFIEDRNGTPVDVLIDSIGIAIGCAVAERYGRLRRRTLGPSRPSAA